MPFYAIAAMSENRVIGDHGTIPWHIPDDFRWFKHKTMGGTLIMGRKTFESIGKPLPGRKTVLLSHTLKSLPDIRVYPTTELLLAGEASSPQPWICGGAEIYRQLLPYCSLLYLTRVHRQVEGDAFFPVFEDTFALHQIIHKTSEFWVECWVNTRQHHELFVESWPFAVDTSDFLMNSTAVL